jgi:hypothetical protein
MKADAAGILLRRTSLAALILTLPGCSGILDGDTALTLDVAEARVLCMGVGPQFCLLVRSEPGAEYGLFYDWIEGFDYEPGYRYRLRVAQTKVEDPPADGSSFAYRLLRVESKQPSPRFELLEAMRKAEAEWEAARPVTYSMVQARECFCGPDSRGPVRLRVTRADGSLVSPFEHVVDQRYVEDGREVPWELRGLFLGVQQLFSHARHAVALDAHVIEIEFDSARGFPRRVFVDWEAWIADDEKEYVVFSLEEA